MKCQILIIALGLALNLPTHVAAASGCKVEKFTHNGSLVDAKSCKGKLTMTYTQLRPELVQRGARKGSMMFTGTEQAGGAISGHALTLDAKCGAIAFAVTGSKQGGAIVLQGNVPVRDQNCQISRNEAYKLVFTPQGSSQAVKPSAGNSPRVVAPSCPAGYVFSNGQCLLTTAPQSGTQPATTSTTFASVAPAPGAQVGVKKKLSGAELTTAIQQELARLGCNPGAVDGDWGKRTISAMTQFNRQTNLSLDTGKPSEAALPALMSITGTICSSPLPPVKSVSPRKAAPKKITVKSTKKKSSSGSAKKKEYWGGEDTRIDCQSAITANCF